MNIELDLRKEKIHEMENSGESVYEALVEPYRGLESALIEIYWTDGEGEEALIDRLSGYLSGREETR